MLFTILIFLIGFLLLWSSPPNDCPSCWKELAEKLTGKVLHVSKKDTSVNMDLSVVQIALKQSGLEEKVTLELILREKRIPLLASIPARSVDTTLILPNTKSIRAFYKSGKHPGTLVFKNTASKIMAKVNIQVRIK